MKENFNVTILLSDDIAQGEIASLQKSLEEQPYVKSLKYISKERALHEQCIDMGTDPSEFLGYNPFTASFEIKVKSEYANNQSLGKIAKQLKGTQKSPVGNFRASLTALIFLFVFKFSTSSILSLPSASVRSL